MASVYIVVDRAEPVLGANECYIARTRDEAQQSFRKVTRDYWPTFIVACVDFQPTQAEVVVLLQGIWPDRIGQLQVRSLYRVTSRGALRQIRLPKEPLALKAAHTWADDPEARAL